MTTTTLPSQAFIQVRGVEDAREAAQAAHQEALKRADDLVEAATRIYSARYFLGVGSFTRALRYRTFLPTGSEDPSPMSSDVIKKPTVRFDVHKEGGRINDDVYSGYAFIESHFDVTLDQLDDVDAAVERAKLDRYAETMRRLNEELAIRKERLDETKRKIKEMKSA